MSSRPIDYRAPFVRLLKRAQPGSRGGVDTHIKRGAHVAQLIARRFPGVNRPEQWRLKHILWLRDCGLIDNAPYTRYHYYLTVRVIALALDRWDGWKGRARGSWSYRTGTPAPNSDRSSRGGRPPKTPGGR